MSAIPGTGSDGSGRLDGQRVLVVGASSGIGRALVGAAARAGALVAGVARRAAVLDEVVAECGPVRTPAIGLPCDVRDPAAVTAMAAELGDRLGGLDAVVYATGVTHLARLADTSVATWRLLFETNVVGAALVVAAVGPLRHRDAGARSGPAGPGRVAVLSSHSVPDPWPALGAYAVSKAALDELVLAWRAELPGGIFARVVVGPTLTPMADGWDPLVAGAMFEEWAVSGRLGQHEPVAPEVVADALVGWLADPEPPLDLSLV